jgi:O-antigen/teichoic acid export membrane protein
MGFRLARGAFWNLAGAAISRGLALAASIFVGRFLGREAYGELGIVQSTVGMFGVVAGMGLGLTATKYIAEHRICSPEDAGRILSNTFAVALGSGSLVSILLVALSPWVASHVLANPELAVLLRCGSLLVVLGALNAVQTGALAGMEAFKTIARVNIWAGFASAPCLVLGAYVAGVVGAVCGLITGMVINAALNHLALRSEAHRQCIKFTYSFAPKSLRFFWDFSLPSLLSGLLGWATTWACAVMLVNTSGGYGEMGIVNATNQWRAALMFIPGLLTATLLPMLANEGSSTVENYRKALDYSHRFISGLVVPLTIVLMLIAKPILACYGTDFTEGRVALVFILAGTAISAISSPIGSVIIAGGRMWAAFALSLLNAAMFASCTWALAESSGSTGLALGYLAGHSVQAVAGIALVQAFLPGNIALRNLRGIGAVLLLTALAVLV